MSKIQDENIRMIGDAFVNDEDVDLVYVKNGGLKLKIKYNDDYATVEYIDDRIFVEVKKKKYNIINMRFCKEVKEALDYIGEKMFNEG